MLWLNDQFHMILIPLARGWECHIEIKAAAWLPAARSALGQDAPIPGELLSYP